MIVHPLVSVLVQQTPAESGMDESGKIASEEQEAGSETAKPSAAAYYFVCMTEAALGVAAIEQSQDIAESGMDEAAEVVVVLVDVLASRKQKAEDWTHSVKGQMRVERMFHKIE